MKHKVLVIDDDPELTKLLRIGLEKDGFDVITANSGKEGLSHAYENRPDIVILDVMMPEMDGWATCRRIRYMCDIPIIMLTAKTDKSDLLKGFSVGVDDYVEKPCSIEELRARIRAVLRRAGASDTWQDAYDDGTLHIDLKNSIVKRDGETIDLTPTQTRLLMCLVSKRGNLVPHEELLTNVWGPAYAEEVSYLSVHIRYLRQKIEEDPSNPTYIRTRWGMGYYFAGNGTFGTEAGGTEE